ncbi:MAG TPA: AAC(3) family N-acetyltransferase [Pirellulaceae bacterium]|nr:AAC(3) family N-acetyltransferase [Pirellulaceae bacterium]HMO94007.1 AAC(3) family N-acetyltransferase [Pirellulaceae bacterium]HMP70880.1 AAC(3) family N-acetyltransferase [Pirellulaceae bacterium]
MAITNKLKRILRKPGTLPSSIVKVVCDKLHRYRWSSPTLKIPSDVTLPEIENFLIRAGIAKGSTLFLHSSWQHLNSGHFTPAGLIKLLLSIIGEEGTLVMPAFPPSILQLKPGFVFDVKRTPSGGGLLADSFRRYAGVRRSINLNHSVCALGPQADYLTRDHHLSNKSWDEFSPYYRLREIEDSWTVGLGVGHRLRIATVLHCVETILSRENAYYRKLFKDEVCYEYKTIEGETGRHCYTRRIGQLYPPKIAKYFSSEELVEDTLQGLEAYAIRTRTLLDRAIELGRKGKTMYVWPIPWPWYFR